MNDRAQGATPLPSHLRRYSLLVVLSLLAAWFASSMPYPYRYAVLPAAIMAGIFVTLALVATIGVPQAAMLRVMLSMGGAFAVMMSIVGMAWIFFAQEAAAQDRCERSALTTQGHLHCQQEFEDALEARFGIVLP